MEASDDNRESALQVLPYASRDQTARQLKYINPAARRSVQLGGSVLILIAVMMAAVEPLGAFFGVLAPIIFWVVFLGPWFFLSAAVIVYAFIGMRRANTSNV